MTNKFENLNQSYDCPTCKKGSLSLKIVSEGTKAVYQCDHFLSKKDGEIEKCNQVIWVNQFNKVLSKKQLDLLIENGETEEIEFVSKNKAFKGSVILSDETTRISFANSSNGDLEEVPDTDCPACGSKIYENNYSYQCEGYKDQSCHISISKKIAQHKITLAEAKTLLEGSTTEWITDFQNKEGESFNAKLFINEDTFKINFDNSICECNCENNGMIKEYAKMYKCDQNVKDDNSCNVLIWKEIAGTKIKIESVEELINSGKTESKLNFTNKKGENFEAFLSLSSEGKASFKYE
jgi:hypothetical protein